MKQPKKISKATDPKMKLEKDLQNLSKQLKKTDNKQQSTQFKQQLRNHILNQANTMNTQNSKGAWNLKGKISNFFKFGLVPATTLALLALFAVQLLTPGGSPQPVFNLVDIASAKDYYTLTPTDKDKSGVKETSTFLLASKDPISASEIKKNIKVQPETDVDVHQKSEKEVIIKPKNALAQNEIYQIKLEAQNIDESKVKKEYSWAYQTSDQFKIYGTLPADKAVHTPINTGIEIHFNYNGVTAEEISKHTTIQPAVQGRWEANGKTLVYISNRPLQEKTHYKVTIGKDLALPQTDQALGEDFTFEFATGTENRADGNIMFTKSATEAEPNVKPLLQVYDYSRSETTIKPNATVYQFKSGQEYADAIGERQEQAPFWCFYVADDYKYDVSSLEQVFTAEELEITEYNYDRFIELPQGLPKGYYLVDLNYQDTNDQMFLQVTDKAVYLNVNSDKSYGWIHDLKTGQPINGAKISIPDLKLEQTTNNEGIAIFESFEYPEDVEGYTSLEPLATITAGGDTLYFIVPTRDSSTNPNFNYFNTDRDVYHPTDKIHFWGFVKGKENPINGKFKAVIQDSKWWWYDVVYADEDEKNYYEVDVEIKDGKVFSGEIDIQKLPASGYSSYSLTIQDDELGLYLNKSFAVQDFVKPEYEIALTPEDSVIDKGQTINIDVAAKFFEGTPVPNTEIMYASGYDYGKGTQNLTTDEIGEASFTYTGIGRTCTENDDYYCTIFSTEYLRARPVKEELADIEGQTVIKVLNSRVGFEIEELDYNQIALTTKKVDEQKVEERSYSYNGGIYTDPAPNTRVKIKIDEIITEKTATGTYYDYINKVTRTKYDYNTRYVPVKTIDNVTSGTNGEVKINPELNTEKNYRFTVISYDQNNNLYKQSRSLYSRYASYANYNEGYGIQSGEEKDNYNIGDNLSLTLTKDGEAVNTPALYVVAKGAPREITLQKDGIWTGIFEEQDIPNISVWAVVFNGKSYDTTWSHVYSYNKENKRLEVEASTNQESYEPGEEVDLQIKVTDKDGIPVSNAGVNVYLVDEAYYALYAQNLSDPLDKLYEYVWTQQGRSLATNETAALMSGGAEGGGCFVPGTQIAMADGSFKNIEDIKVGDEILTRESPLSNETVNATVRKLQRHYVNNYFVINNEIGITGEHILFVNGQWNRAENIQTGDHLTDKNGNRVPVTSIVKINDNVPVFNFEVEKYHTYIADGVYVHNDKGGAREEFKDTAVFRVITTNSNGIAQTQFELPDNITSWRLTATAIDGQEVEAGYSTEKIAVTKPVFTVPVINSEYLLGDKPSIPVRAFGTTLTAESTVDFKMKSDTLNYEGSVTGKAYTPSYFTFDSLTTGTHKLETTSKSGTNEDTIILPTTVKTSHLNTWNDWNSAVTENTKLEGSTENRTEVTFSNNELGPILGTLYSATYNPYNRADSDAAEATAKKLLNEYLNKEYKNTDLDNELYQIDMQEQSGNSDTVGYAIAIVPYADPDLKLTSLLLNVDPSLWSTKTINLYLQSVLENPKASVAEKIRALYGLSAGDTKFLNDLNILVEENELTLEDKIFAGLTYANYRADNLASDLLVDILENHTASTARNTIYVKAETKDEEISFTALTAALALSQSATDHELLWEHVLSNGHEAEDLHIAEEMIYVNARIEAGVSGTVSLRVNGEKVELEGWNTREFSFLPEEIGKVKFGNIEGEILVTTRYQEPAELSDFNTDDTVQITRKYFVDGVETSSFKPGDIVKVEIEITVPFSHYGSYQVRDYLPSGLQIAGGASGIDRFNYARSIEPTKTDNQEAVFHIYCASEEAKSYDKCNDGRKAHYYARVINKGEFITEPAVLQYQENQDVINLSSTERGQITIE